MSGTPAPAGSADSPRCGRHSGGPPMQRPASNMRRTVHASGWMYFRRRLLFGWALLLTHQFGIADYGVFAIAFALGAIIGTPIDSYFTVRAPRVSDEVFDGERTTRVLHRPRPGLPGLGSVAVHVPLVAGSRSARPASTCASRRRAVR